jgi:hypothetical protein
MLLFELFLLINALNSSSSDNFLSEKLLVLGKFENQVFFIWNKVSQGARVIQMCGFSAGFAAYVDEIILIVERNLVPQHRESLIILLVLWLF